MPFVSTQGEGESFLSHRKRFLSRDASEQFGSFISNANASHFSVDVVSCNLLSHSPEIQLQLKTHRSDYRAWTRCRNDRTYCVVALAKWDWIWHWIRWSFSDSLTDRTSTKRRNKQTKKIDRSCSNTASCKQKRAWARSFSEIHRLPFIPFR